LKTILKTRFWLVLGLFMAIGYGASGQFAPYLGYEVEGHYFDSAGVALHYTVQGVGEPLILLHGFAMNSDLTWRNSGAVGRLAQDFEVITLDCRGHGYSGRPEDSAAYGIEMVRDIVRLLDHLGIQKAHIAGNSMGAIIVIKMLAEYPDRMLSAIPCGMGYPRVDSDNMEAVNRLADSLEKGDGFRPLLEHLYPGGEPSWFSVAAIDTLVGYLNDTKALVGVARGMAELEACPEDLAHADVPVLSIVAEHDPLLRDVPGLADCLLRHQTVVIPDANHFDLTDDPACTEAMLGFLHQHMAPAIQGAA
jgi:pimeloyl-ACP methyl ester carboxylesterase